MRLLLDMNLPTAVADWLRSAGHEAIDVRELGLGDVPDREVFERAAADSRIVVTFDLEFWRDCRAGQRCCGWSRAAAAKAAQPAFLPPPGHCGPGLSSSWKTPGFGSRPDRHHPNKTSVNSSIEPDPNTGVKGAR